MAIMNFYALVFIPAAHEKSSGFTGPGLCAEADVDFDFYRGPSCTVSVLEKKPLWKAAHPFLEVAFQMNSFLWQ